MGWVRVVWVWPERIRSIPSPSLASCWSSDFRSRSSVPLWDSAMINCAPCSSRLSTQRWAACTGSSSVKPEVGAQSSESVPIRPKMP